MQNINFDPQFTFRFHHAQTGKPLQYTGMVIKIDGHKMVLAYMNGFPYLFDIEVTDGDFYVKTNGNTEQTLANFQPQNIIQENVTHKAIKGHNGIISIYTKGLVLEGKIYPGELLYSNVPEDDLLAYFDRFDEDNRGNMFELKEEMT